MTVSGIKSADIKYLPITSKRLLPENTPSQDIFGWFGAVDGYAYSVLFINQNDGVSVVWKQVTKMDCGIIMMRLEAIRVLLNEICVRQLSGVKIYGHIEDGVNVINKILEIERLKERSKTTFKYDSEIDKRLCEKITLDSVSESFFDEIDKLEDSEETLFKGFDENGKIVNLNRETEIFKSQRYDERKTVEKKKEESDSKKTGSEYPMFKSQPIFKILYSVPIELRIECDGTNKSESLYFTAEKTVSFQSDLISPDNLTQILENVSFVSNTPVNSILPRSGMTCSPAKMPSLHIWEENGNTVFFLEVKCKKIEKVFSSSCLGFVEPEELLRSDMDEQWILTKQDFND